jgi:hypothetical protein
MDRVQCSNVTSHSHIPASSITTVHFVIYWNYSTSYSRRQATFTATVSQCNSFVPSPCTCLSSSGRHVNTERPTVCGYTRICNYSTMNRTDVPTLISLAPLMFPPRTFARSPVTICQEWQTYVKSDKQLEFPGGTPLGACNITWHGSNTERRNSLFTVNTGYTTSVTRTFIQKFLEYENVSFNGSCK